MATDRWLGWTAVFLLATVGVSQAGDPKPAQAEPEKVSTAEIRKAIEKSLPLLEKGARGSLEQRKQCFTCHNQGLPILALTAARDHGFEIDEEHLGEQVKFIAGFLKRNQQKFLDGKGTGGQVDTAGYALWTLDRGDYAPNEVTSAVAEYLLLFQKDADYWKVGSNRPPSEASSITTSYLAIRGLERYATEEQQPSAKERRKKALKWFIQVEAKDNEDRVFRLRALHTLAADAAEIKRAGEQLASRQGDDGGWSQLDGGESDAYATATALVALFEAKHWTAESPSYRQGLRYLLSQQQEDGSWKVTSRSKPFQAYFESGYPHGKDQFISITAGSWATIALAYALPTKAEKKSAD